MRYEDAALRGLEKSFPDGWQEMYDERREEKNDCFLHHQMVFMQHQHKVNLEDVTTFTPRVPAVSPQL